MDTPMIRRQIRDWLRELFGLGRAPTPGSRAGRDARRAVRLAADAAAWKKYEAAAREEREYEAAIESETLRAQLERRRYL